MRFLFITLCMTFVLAIQSCSPSIKYKAQLQEIDSCMTVLDEIETKLNGIDFDSLKFMVAHVIRNEDTLKKYYDPDTLSLDLGIKMNEAKGLKKTMGNLESKEYNYRLEIEELRKQFKDLKTDIENGVLEEEKINSNLEAEKIMLNHLNISVHDFNILQEQNKVFYYHATPDIDALILELKNETETQE